MKNNKYKKKQLNTTVCDNDSYFYRSNEHFRTNLDNVEFSKENNLEAGNDIADEKSENFSSYSNKHIQNNFDYEQNFLYNLDEYPKESDTYSIYDYDIENNNGHEWGNKER